MFDFKNEDSMDIGIWKKYIFWCSRGKKEDANKLEKNIEGEVDEFKVILKFNDGIGVHSLSPVELIMKNQIREIKLTNGGQLTIDCYNGKALGDRSLKVGLGGQWRKK